ncbi:hypothetical protein D3C71_1742180 [compost metagenome]
MFAAGAVQLGQPGRGHFIHPAAEDLVDEVLLGAEVVIDRGDVHIRLAGDLAQRGAREPVQGEQFLGSAEDAVLGGEVGRFGHGAGQFNQTIV